MLEYTDRQLKHENLISDIHAFLFNKFTPPHLVPQSSVKVASQKCSNSNARFAIAFSGGGDSTALLHALRSYSARSMALIVDHGLRAGSRDEAYSAKAFAERLGYEAHVLTWAMHDGGMDTGLQEKARQARYGLLGQACRKASLGVLVTGHTQNDQAETLFMRYERNTDWRGACGMSRVRYAPLWPELAEVTVLRPLLHVSRNCLRSYNKLHGLDWIEDPSNSSLEFSRIQARQYLRDHPKMQDILLEPVQALCAGRSAESARLQTWAEANMRVSEFGFIRLLAVPPVELLFQCLRAVGGTGGPIDRSKLRTLIYQMRQTGFKASTLAGSKVEKYGVEFLISRDLVAVKGRRGVTPILDKTLLKAEPNIWDGRFFAQSLQTGWYIKPAYKMTQTLSSKLKDTLMSLPAPIRPTLPLLYDSSGNARAVGPYNEGGVKINALIYRRLCV